MTGREQRTPTTGPHAVLPGDDLAEYWARQHGFEPTPLRAWGLPLVRDGALLRNAGKADLPGVVPSLAAPPLEPSADARGAVALVLHDIADNDGALTHVLRASGARAYLRYECASADFGRDPDAYARRTLSTKRRKRLRHDLRQLGEAGDVTARWVEPDEAEDMFEHFFRMLCLRAASAKAYDPNLLRREYLLGLWRRFAGRDLLVNVLLVGGAPVSFRTGFAVGGRFLGYMPAIDRAFSTASMGDVHMWLLLPQLVERGVTSYSMGKGTGGNKDVWATAGYTLSTVVVPLSRSLRAQASLELEGANQRARRAVTRNGWDRPLRRLLHGCLDRPGSPYRRNLDQARGRS